MPSVQNFCKKGRLRTPDYRMPARGTDTINMHVVWNVTLNYARSMLFPVPIYTPCPGPRSGFTPPSPRPGFTPSLHVSEAVQFSLHNPQNLGICKTKTLGEVHQTLLSPPKCKREKSGLTTIY